MARTRPVWAARLAHADHGGEPRRGLAPASPPAPPAIVLDLGEAAWAGVPCWSGRGERWATFTVPVAYAARYDTHVRPLMPGNPISLKTLVRVARARARYAEYATGRGSRPTNERLATDTGLSVRTVQRADTALRLLGLATEVLRGRQRTRAERLASWRAGDRGRGWASVWALHDHPFLHRFIHRLGLLSPHPEGSPERNQNSRKDVVATGRHRRSGAGDRAAPRRASPDAGGLALAQAWRADGSAPPWCHRHSAAAWAPLLAAPAAHRWTPRDLNQLVTDWLGVGRRIPDSPYKPIGLLGAMLAWHGTENLDERPAAADMAREAAELAAHQAHLGAQRAAAAAHQHARETGRRALASAGHSAARAIAAEAARRGARKRAVAVAEDAALSSGMTIPAHSP